MDKHNNKQWLCFKTIPVTGHTYIYATCKSRSIYPALSSKTLREIGHFLCEHLSAKHLIFPLTSF